MFCSKILGYANAVKWKAKVDAIKHYDISVKGCIPYGELKRQVVRVSWIPGNSPHAVVVSIFSCS